MYNQLNNLLINANSCDFHFKGNYNEPAEEKIFAGSILAREKKYEPFSKLKLEISLQYELMEWKVKLLVYEKEREDDEPAEKL